MRSGLLGRLPCREDCRGRADRPFRRESPRATCGALRLQRPGVQRQAHASPGCRASAAPPARRICRSEIPDHLRHALRARTPERIVLWLETEGVQAAHTMNLYERDRNRIYFLHWAIASGWSEKLPVLWYSLVSPWHEGSGFGRLISFTRRMAQRTRHLLASFADRGGHRMLHK